MRFASARSLVALALMLVSGVVYPTTPSVFAAPQVQPHQAASGFVSPSARLNVAFAFPDNAFANDANVALRIGTNNATPQSYNGYGLQIPADAVIDGIQVRVDAWRPVGACPASLNVSLSWDGGANATAVVNTGTLGTADPEGALVLGGPTGTWGRMWTATELNESLVVRVNTVNLAAGCQLALDWIPVQVYYSASPPSNTNTPTPTVTDTFLPSPSNTYTLTPLATVTNTSSATPTATVTDSATGTAAPTATLTATLSFTHTPTLSVTAEPTATESGVATATPTPTITATPTEKLPEPLFPTETATPTAQGIEVPSPTPTETATPPPEPTTTHTTTHTFTASATTTPTGAAHPAETDTSTVLPTASSTPTDTPSATPTAGAAFAPLDIVINEVAWAGTAANALDEWLELFNNTSVAIDLTGWTLASDDGTPSIALAGSIPAQGYFLLERTDDNTVSDISADQIYVGGLNNDGEMLTLRDAANTLIDTANVGSESWSSGSVSPRCSMERVNRTLADAAANWATNDHATRSGLDAAGNPICGTPKNENAASMPQAPRLTPTASATSTLTNTPTATPTFTPTKTPEAPFAPLAVVINEVAWAGTQANSTDEWIELFNNTDAAIDLSGWTVRDDGDVEILLGGTISASGYFLLERTDDNTVGDISAAHIYVGSLNNLGETLTLRDRTSTVIDTANNNGGAWDAGAAAAHCSMERIEPQQIDSEENWTTNDGVTQNGHDAENRPICGTPNGDNAAWQKVPTPTPAHTSTPTLTATPAPGKLFVNEFMPDPAADWNLDGVVDEGDEWIEIYNGNGFRVNLSGWVLDDVIDAGSAEYRLPEGFKIGPKKFKVIYRADSGIALNNANDDVVLRAPDSSVADSISYKSSDPNTAWGRSPDGAAFFSVYCPPTPRRSNCSISPTPTITPTPFAAEIFINEFLPVPYFDWNGDEILDSDDEWIELYNASSRTVDLSGWQLDDARAGSAPFEIPEGTLIAPYSLTVFFASETGIGLNNTGDAVRLLFPDENVADRKEYEPIVTNATYARLPDGSEAWVTYCKPTPGAVNCSRQPTPEPTRVYQLRTIAEARLMPDGAQVSVLGSVIERPCELAPSGHDMTISDGMAGLHVYFGYPGSLDCSIARHEQVIVTGRLGDFYGLRTIYPQSRRDVERTQRPPYEIAARHVRTGDFGEHTESMRVMIEGAISNGRGGDVLWVNDGTGIVEVRVRYGGLTRGSRVRIYGMAHQKNRGKLPDEGYALLAWLPDDLLVLELADKLPQAPGGRGGVDLGAVSIGQALVTRLQNYVTVGGVVTVPPGIIGERDFWIQDANGSGVRIFVAESAGALPKLKLYENVSVRGRVVSFFGAREIRVELPDAIGAYGRGEPVTPRTVATGEVNFSSEGTLVAIQGFVARADGREIYIDDGSGEVLVYMDATTRIRWPRLKRGDPARITGVVARFGGAPEILPRYQSDVQFGQQLLPVAGGAGNSFLFTLRANGRAGEDLAITRRVRGEASGKLTRRGLEARRAMPVSRRVERVEEASGERDSFAVLSLVVLTALGVSAFLKVRRSRRGGLG